MQGLAFDDDGNLWASEFGQSTYDELNLIRQGGNYGWPEVEGRGDEADFVNPRVVWSTSQASPSGPGVRRGPPVARRAARHPALAGRGRPTAQASDPTPFFVGEYGRLRTVEVAPDGNLWVTTSNRDGRGDPAAEDDRILVVRPGTR